MSNQDFSDHQEGGCGGILSGGVANFILGWIVYRSFRAGIANSLISTGLVIFSLLIGTIPMIGPVAYWFGAKAWIMPLFTQYGVEIYWLTQLYFWGGLITSIIRTILVTLVLINKFK